MQAVGVAGDGVAQLGQAKVVGVEGLAGLQRGNGRLTDHVGGDFIAFAKPEAQHAFTAHAFVGHFADARFLQTQHHLTHAFLLLR